MFGYLERLLAWLKQGYPQGIPEADVVPLLAVLRRRLSDEEILQVADGLRGDGLLPADRTDVGAAFLKLTDELPSDAEVQRIMDRLRAAGVELTADGVPDTDKGGQPPTTPDTDNGGQPPTTPDTDNGGQPPANS